MEEDFSNALDPIFVPYNNIRLIQTKLQAQLENFHKRWPVASFMDTYTVCENVRDKVLNHEDEPYLSKSQNNYRRISIASELFVSICSIYGQIVDYEFTKIIDTLIQWEKYKYISKKITHKMQLELKREKYFIKEAQGKLQKSLEGKDDRALEGCRETASRPVCERTELITEAAIALRKSTPSKNFEPVEAANGTTPTDEIINNVLGPASEISTTDETSSAMGNLSRVRAESVFDTYGLQSSNILTHREANSFLTSIPEIQIQETNLQKNDEDDLKQILKILEDEIIEKVNEMEEPETLLETMNRSREIVENLEVEKLPTLDENPMDQLEDSEEWNLPNLDSTKKTKKKRHHVIIDERIIIRNYSQRALHLNSNINIQRVQVFEGPPKVLQAMSVNHLMSTPGFKSSLFKDVRNSKLNTLFKRHLKLEKKVVEDKIVPQRRDLGESKTPEISKVRTNEEMVEDFAVRAGMHASLPRRSNVLAEFGKEYNELETLGISTVGVPQKDSLVGIPMSRIVTPALMPPDVERINLGPVLSTPRAQQLQGKRLDTAARSSWFHSTKETPPRAKYREFNYIYGKLQEYWSLFENQGMERSISLREFFRSEVDASTADFLTVLRIIDKLSIQRKLYLEYQTQDVLIRPFEKPFVSEVQVQLKEKVPIL